jgi:tubulin-specific chaperone B
MADVSVYVKSDQTSSERRLNPNWTIASILKSIRITNTLALKSKLETITGIPPDSQSLSFKLSDGESVPINPTNDEETQLSAYNAHLRPYITLFVDDTRPESERVIMDSNTEHFTLSKEEYEARPDTVLAWKKHQKLGRFDPDRESTLQSLADSVMASYQAQIEQRGIKIGSRCKIGEDSQRRGTVRFVGPIDDLPGGGLWVGVEYDEPVGKNDGCVGDKRYFNTGKNRGGFVRPNRVIIGDFPEEDILDSEEEEM